MDQAGQDRFAAAGAAADLVVGFHHGHVEAGLCQGDRGGQAVGPGPHDGRGAHASTSWWWTCPLRLTAGAAAGGCGAVQVIWVGMGPSGSQGCAATASATCQVPRSITPSAASITL